MHAQSHVESRPATQTDGAAGDYAQRMTGAGAVALALAVVAGIGGGDRSWSPPPSDAAFDYQISGDYPLPPGVEVVARDWFEGRAPDGAYTICYVNAFQTQADEIGVARRDERSAWPEDLVLSELGDDPEWGGEYLVDISTAAKRRRAARWVGPMIDACAGKGFEAVEYDNLDSWTRFDGTPLAARVPFGRRDAIAYAALLTDRAHSRGLAAGQKNTPQLTRRQARRRIGFDFAVAEQCARYRACTAYRRLHGDRVIDIEYRVRDFRRACRTVGPRLSVVLRDVAVSTPASPGYRFANC